MNKVKYNYGGYKAPSDKLLMPKRKKSRSESICQDNVQPNIDQIDTVNTYISEKNSLIEDNQNPGIAML